jgi:hypothetical protein
MNPLVVLGLKALGVLAAIGLLLWSIHAIDQSRQQIGYDRRVAEDNGDLVKAQAEALATERELNRKLEEAERIRAQRARVDAERQNVELEAGEVVQQQRDKRNALYEGNRKAQAAVDTLKTYMPSTAERVTDIVESVGVEAITEHKAGRAAVPTVELGAKSIESMARAVSRSPIIAKPEQSSSSKAVEDSKAKNRGGANY